MRIAALAGLGVALVATHVTAEVYAIQGFLAVLLLGSLAYVAAARDRERVRDDLGRSKEELGGSPSGSNGPAAESRSSTPSWWREKARCTR